MEEASDYRLIPLTQGQFAKVSAHRYEDLMQWKWYASRSPNGFYAIRKVRQSSTRTVSILMHRHILGLQAGDGKEGDHANLDTLDDRDENLRVATRAQNLINRKMKRTKSPYRGAIPYPQGSRKKWRSVINTNGKIISLGYFVTPEEAAEAYAVAARQYHGEFARFD